jgi:hypothetical protein
MQWVGQLPVHTNYLNHEYPLKTLKKPDYLLFYLPFFFFYPTLTSPFRQCFPLVATAMPYPIGDNY